MLCTALSFLWQDKNITGRRSTFSLAMFLSPPRGRTQLLCVPASEKFCPLAPPWHCTSHSLAPLLPPTFRQQCGLKLGASDCVGEGIESFFSTTLFNSSFSFRRGVLRSLPCWLFLQLHVCPQNTVFWQNSGLKRKFIGKLLCTSDPGIENLLLFGNILLCDSRKPCFFPHWSLWFARKCWARFVQQLLSLAAEFL